MRRVALPVIVVCAVAVVWGYSQGGALPRINEAGALRCCSDPKHLPFSHQDRREPGFEVELGRELARQLSLERSGVPMAAQAAGDQAAQAETNVGERLYGRSCAECHGLKAQGGALAPSLTAFKGTDDDFVKTILNGRSGTGMPPFKGLLSEEEIRQIRAYIGTLPK
jgi:cytochrome c55X